MPHFVICKEQLRKMMTGLKGILLNRTYGEIRAAILKIKKCIFAIEETGNVVKE